MLKIVTSRDGLGVEHGGQDLNNDITGARKCF